MTMKRKDMTKAQLETEARTVNLPGRSKMARGEMAQALNANEMDMRINRFGSQPLTAKQSRRVKQKMNRQH